MALSTGTIIHQRYRVVNLLGQGGFGAVYRAWDLNLSRPCALKENLETSPEAQKQFTREAVILANLIHPNLSRVTDYFSIPDQGQYLVMDYVEGEDLQQILDKQGPLPEAKVIQWISQICDALAYLHQQTPPVIHRDVKPANIKIDKEGKAVLVDFGVAKIWDPNQRTTQGARAITPGFSPFEQYGQAPTDARSDIYALGATAYCLITGQPPVEAITRMAGTPLEPVSTLRPDINPGFAQAVTQALSVMPEARFSSASAFKNALAVPVTRPQPKEQNRMDTVHVAGSLASSSSVQGMIAVAPVSSINTPVQQKRKKNILPIMAGIIGTLVIIAGIAIAAIVLTQNRPTPAAVYERKTTQEDTQTEVTEEVTPEEATTEIVEVIPTLAPGETITVELWVTDLEGTSNLEYFEPLVDTYQQEHPGVTIQLEAIPVTEDVFGWLSTSLAAGDRPSAFLIDSSVMSSLQENDMLRNLDGLYITNEYLPTTIEMVTKEDSVWGVPLSTTSMLLLYYNKDLFTANGFDPNNPPKNTDELLDIHKQFLEKTGQAGLVYASNITYWMLPWIFGYGGDLFASDGQTISLGTEEVQQAMNLTMLLVSTGETENWNDYPTAENLFISQEAAMIINGTWAYQMYKDALGDNLGIAPLPKVSDTGLPSSSPISGMVFSLPAGGDKLEQDIALDFIHYVTTTESMLTGETNFSIMPANVSLINSLMMTGDPMRVALGETAMNARYLSNKPEMNCVWDALNSALSNVINKVASYSSFANDAQAQADSCIIDLNK